MTGTGTQEDPYIVDNWADFVIAVGTSGAYIEFDSEHPTKIIDMNEVAQSGIESKTECYCRSIKGNGWEIRNLFSRLDDTILFFNNTVTIRDFNIVGFKVQNNLMYIDGGSYRTNAIYFINCQLSGISVGTKSLFRAYSGSVSECFMDFNQCSLHIRRPDGGAIFAVPNGSRSSRFIFRDCNLYFDGKLTSTEFFPYYVGFVDTTINGVYRITEENAKFNGSEFTSDNLTCWYFIGEIISDIENATLSFNANPSTGSFLINNKKNDKNLIIDTGANVHVGTNEQCLDLEFLESIDFIAGG